MQEAGPKRGIVATGTPVLPVAVVALAAAILLAGCTGPASPAAPHAAGSADAEGSAAAAAAARAANAPLFLTRAEGTPAAPAIPVSLALSQQWLKPFGQLEALSTAPMDARVAWFVEHEEVDPRASVVEGEVYVLKSTTPDHHASDMKRGRADLADVAPDGRARTLRVEVPGRYTLEAEGARLVVNVWPDAPFDGSVQAILVDDPAREGGVRFEPAELDLATGGRLLVWNQAERAVDVREVNFAAHVPLPAHGGRVTPIDEGLYHLVLVARDALGARGSARVPFLVDFERPAERLGVGPATGRFLVAELGAASPDAGAAVEPPYRLAFGAQHPLRTLAVRFNATSAAPAPFSVEVTLLHEDRPLASASTLTASEILLVDLPAGSYAVEVRPEHGAAVSFELTATGLYALPTPERLRDAMT